jgi:tRNA nucleotidyltransferase (CCA-adding enzyme)
MVVDEARRQIHDLSRGPASAIMLAALCHDLGKPATTVWREGRIRSPGHEEAGVPIASAVLDRLNVQTLDGYNVRAATLGLVAEHMRPAAFQQSATPPGDGAFRRLSQRVDLELLARFAEADCRGRKGSFDCSASARFLERARSLGVEHAPPAPLVLGRHILSLGVPPGRRVGEILQVLYEKQLDGDILTLEDGLAVARTLIEQRS